ncbi:hypothetical protein ACKAV7_007403 [Fusarium commune]
MTKTVVILGAGWAGLPLAHKLLKHTLPKVPDLKVILVPEQSLLLESLLTNQAGFNQYPSENFEFLLGKADGVDVESSTVHVISNENNRREITYDELVIATGSRLASDLPLKPVGTHQETISAWKQLQGEVGDSKSIVIAGGGATGTEVAGELAARYGSSKSITLVSGEQPLEGALDSVRASISRDLKTLGVKLIYNARVTESKRSERGQGAEVHLSNGSTLTTDLYLPLHGIKLNTSFVPPSFLDTGGNIKLDEKMKIAGTKNIWGIGDVGNIDPSN